MLERAGVATVLIGLVPQQVERMRPPRALLVPFDLGRPLGTPGAPDFQRRVLAATLQLASRQDVPVVEWFPDEAPAADSDASEEGWACPISLPAVGASDDAKAALGAEVARLRPWHDRATRDRGRTATGASGLDIDSIVDLLTGLETRVPDQFPVAGLSPGHGVKLAAEDLKQFYLEAATARPGGTPDQIADWFWNQTEAGALLRRLAASLADHQDRELSLYAAFTLVPEAQRQA